MAHRVCPPFIGYFLLNPLRRLIENPDRMFRGLVREGMTVLEPGCGMGYFTLPLARMVGASGRVVVVDIEPKMLAVLEKRATKAGLAERIERRLADVGGFKIADLAGKVDLAVAIHMVHEMPDQATFFAEIEKALSPGGKMLVIEPRGHVKQAEFQESLRIARASGLAVVPEGSSIKARRLLLQKPAG